MGIRILVVDETAFARDSLKRSLRRFLSDVEVFDAPNGSRALPLLRANKMNIVIADWELPEMSGEELLRWVRNDETYQKIPFIIVSSITDKSMVMNAVQAGASDFMAKPFSPDELQKKVVKQLAKIGYRPKQKGNGSAGSLETLTSGVRKPTVMKPRKIESADSFFKNKKPSSADVLTGGTKKGGFNGSALLLIGQQRVRCEVNDLSLTGINLIAERPDPMFTVFDSAKIEIADDKANILATLNVYIHMLQAYDQRPDSSKIKLTARFINNKPEQMKEISRVIAKG